MMYSTWVRCGRRGSLGSPKYFSPSVAELGAKRYQWPPPQEDGSQDLGGR